MNRKQQRAAQKADDSTPARASPVETASPAASVPELTSLAFQHYQAGRLSQAERLYQRALAVDPNDVNSLHLLGIIAHQLGRSDLAITLIGKAITLNPRVPEFHNNIGLACQALGRLDDATTHYANALALRPQFAEVHNNLGHALEKLSQWDEAVACYHRAIALKPDYAEPHYNLGNILQAQGKLAEAAACYGRALSHKPDYAEVHNNLGNALQAQGKLVEAVAFYQRALALKPDFAEAHANLGIVSMNIGRIDVARKHFETAIELEPRNPAYYLHCGETRRFLANDAHLVAMEELAKDPASLPLQQQIELHFALAKAYADVKDYQRSFQNLLKGNALKRAQIRYDEAATMAWFDSIEAVFTPELLREKEGLGGSQSATPIFVIGMPRSGTTLIEQILASHPQVHGAGELQTFGDIVKQVHELDGNPMPYPQFVPRLDAAAIANIGARYVREIRKLAPSAPYVTDKMPSNYSFVGLIHLALPNARIVHTVRDPVDTCVSCFSKLFGAEQNHTYDLAELGRYYRRYLGLMAHWHRVLPEGRILEVRYEDVVADLEVQARRIVAHCGLDWDARCLSFHATKRPVRTASAVQVRQPIYRTAVGRWRAYEGYLSPLLDALAGQPVAP